MLQDGQFSMCAQHLEKFWKWVAGGQVPIFVSLDEGLTDGIGMYGAYRIYLGMQAKGLSKQCII